MADRTILEDSDPNTGRQFTSKNTDFMRRKVLWENNANKKFGGNRLGTILGRNTGTEDTSNLNDPKDLGGVYQGGGGGGYASSSSSALGDPRNGDYYKGLIQSALDGTLASYLATYNANRAKVGADYEAALNQNALNWRRAQKSAREALANLGQTNSGIAANRNMAIDSKYSNQETNLLAQKANALRQEEADYQNKVAVARQNAANNILKYM